ncbi:hypothetical protein Snoj_62280 [Streptomyces nojiriensis]|uniref:Uncharacterized protein n=1 Tax=Streptomyces nojiriensis TaxID=66374 RepID=A0ABQ3SVZ4_9ACTN|nr:hypothetical protein GCM10010205_18310 [Streptomyces nojiriensis]GHI72310.1 hypothetical protein Snoj_62280 [Streptomyces nojiriensis]
MQDGGGGREGGREGAGQGGGGGPDPGDVQQAGQGWRGVGPADDSLLDGGSYGQIAARGSAPGGFLGAHVGHPIIRQGRPQLLTESIQSERM